MEFQWNFHRISVAFQHFLSYNSDIFQHLFSGFRRYSAWSTSRAQQTEQIALSRRPDFDNGNPDNEDVTVWPDKYFCSQHTVIRILDTDSTEQRVKLMQYTQQPLLKQWAVTHNLSLLDGTHWHRGTALVIVGDNELKGGVTSIFHNHMTAGHPRISKTLQLLVPYYWWPH